MSTHLLAMRFDPVAIIFWFVQRLAEYVVILIATAITFVIGAALYVLIAGPGARPAIIDREVERPSAPAPNLPALRPKSDERMGELPMASATPAPVVPTGVGVVGSVVLAKDQRPIGRVTDIVLNQNGLPKLLIVGVPTSEKYLSIPFGEIKWKKVDAVPYVFDEVPVRGMVNMSHDEIVKLFANAPTPANSKETERLPIEKQKN